MNPSKRVVVEFVNALGTWLEESLFRRLHKAPFSGADNLLSLGGEWCTRRTLH